MDTQYIKWCPYCKIIFGPNPSQWSNINKYLHLEYCELKPKKETKNKPVKRNQNTPKKITEYLKKK